MKNYGPEIREQATALVSRSLGMLDGAARDRLNGRYPAARQIIYAAAEDLLAAERAGGPLPTADSLLRVGLDVAGWSDMRWWRLPKSVRSAVEDAIGLLWQRDPEPEQAAPRAADPVGKFGRPQDSEARRKAVVDRVVADVIDGLDEAAAAAVEGRAAPAWRTL